MREVLQTRQAGINDGDWNNHQACKKDEVLRQMLLNWQAGIDMQLEELEIAEWEDEDGFNCIGTRLKSNKAKHGIVRTIVGGGFYDKTFVEGVQEGIEVFFWASSRVWVRYYENDEEQSCFYFKPLDGFKEGYRDGEKLSHLTGKTFDPNVFDSQEPQQTTYKPSQIVREAEMKIPETRLNTFEDQVVAFSARITNTEEDNLEQSERIAALEEFREAHRSQGALGRLFGKR
jgi:hypothetical protein